MQAPFISRLSASHYQDSTAFFLFLSSGSWPFQLTKRLAIMIKITLSLLSALTLFFTQPVAANVEVKFVESAPKDRFELSNTRECVLKDLIVEIDLRQSDGGLIFDTAESGSGVDVFQPFEVGGEGIELFSPAGVRDGDTSLSVIIKSLPPGKSVSFTIDVDDTLPKSELGQTRVSGSEIKNGSVKISFGGQEPIVAIFGVDSTAIVFLPACP